MSTPKQLSLKQQAFINEYVIDKNATQAAIRAGYARPSARVQGARLLAHPEVRAAIDQKVHQAACATQTEAEWVRARLREEATDFSERSTHSGRIRALELLGKVNGMFNGDNRQSGASAASEIAALLTAGRVIGPQPQDSD